MDTEGFCVNCNNKKPINKTCNRLVTESCGHVKCMDCLLHETSGCIACARSKEDILNKDCNETNTNGSALNYEILTNHEKEDFADKPKEVENKKKKLETAHIKVETDANGKYYLCTVCNKRFHARSHVQYHAYCNGQRKPYQCKPCNKSFASHSHYNYHMRVHRKERLYSCETCGDSFYQMSKLQRHRLKHTKEKKHACLECGKTFSDARALRNHSASHVERKPHVCETCGRAFRDFSNWKKHVDNHKGAAAYDASKRRYKCPRCPQAFHTVKDMRRHYAVHTDSKPFRCKVCNRRFRRKDNLERHIRNTHPDYNLDTSSAVECDENALKQIIQVNLQTNSHESKKNNTDDSYQNNQRSKLEILNPLPPLPEDILQKHMFCKDRGVFNFKDLKDITDVEVTDKYTIREANIARKSVIFGPVKRDSIEMKSAQSVEFEYVHKIRQANTLAKQKALSLPPIDEQKFLELEKKNVQNNLDVGKPTRNVELYKKILYEKPDKEMIVVGDNDLEKSQRANVNPEMHWKRKMKLQINW